MLHVQYVLCILCTVYQCFSCIHTFLPPPLLQCIDPYINDTDTKQCSLDTDGDMIPDYRVRACKKHIRTYHVITLALSLIHCARHFT